MAIELKYPDPMRGSVVLVTVILDTDYSTIRLARAKITK